MLLSQGSETWWTSIAIDWTLSLPDCRPPAIVADAAPDRHHRPPLWVRAARRSSRVFQLGQERRQLPLAHLRRCRAFLFHVLREAPGAVAASRRCQSRESRCKNSRRRSVSEVARVLRLAC
jgi:hypothetical protein